MTKGESMDVFCIVKNDETGKKDWVKIGKAFFNEKNVNIKLRSAPFSRDLQIASYNRESNDEQRSSVDHEAA